MDRYASDLKSAQEKGQTGKIQICEQKYEAAKLNYHTLNEELLEDLPALFEDRIPFFNPVFATVSAIYLSHTHTQSSTGVLSFPPSFTLYRKPLCFSFYVLTFFFCPYLFLVFDGSFGVLSPVQQVFHGVASLGQSH